jgi:hypothetical protein
VLTEAGIPKVIVPEVVIGDPETEICGPPATATEVTVPEPPVDAIVMFEPEGVIEIPEPATKVRAPVSPLREVTLLFVGQVVEAN